MSTVLLLLFIVIACKCMHVPSASACIGWTLVPLVFGLTQDNPKDGTQGTQEPDMW